MKFNWGTGIAVFYSSFVLLMILMVITSFQNKAELVQENYYQLDLNYEEFRQKRQNGNMMAGEITLDFNAATNTLQITFPNQMKNATGEVRFFRPSSKYLDATFPINLDENANMSTSLKTQNPVGLWKLIIDWEANGISYYKEESLVL